MACELVEVDSASWIRNNPAVGSGGTHHPASCIRNNPVVGNHLLLEDNPLCSAGEFNPLDV